MTDQHPITPPSELVGQWSETIYQQTEQDDERDLYIANQAAQWGADQELEACAEWLKQELQQPGWANRISSYFLYAARRPKPPSLKEQALALLDDASDRLDAVHENTIRRALEALPND